MATTARRPAPIARPRAAASLPAAPPLPVEGLAAAAEALAGGTLTSRALTDAVLARAGALQPALNAFRIIRDGAARAESRAADARLRGGERAPLLGVPVAIKDDTPLAGETTPFGTAGEHPVEPADGGVVRRLREAGAVIVGKTTTPELGLFPFTEGPAFGATRNPYALDRTPGGSSGGSAAAVAAGIVPAAVGSDGAGSIRIPAAWCGLVGIKPQRGRVPSNAHDFHGLAVNGPLARSVADAALLLDVLSGEAGMPFSAAAAAAPRPLRIGLSWRTPFGAPARVHPDVRAAVEAVAADLRALGHTVVDAEPAHATAGAMIVPRGMHGDWQAFADMPGAQLEGRVRTNVRLGRLLGGPVVRAARQAQGWLEGRVARVYEDVDVLLTPTTAKRALRVGQLDGRSWWTTENAASAACPYAFAWNVLGWPGVNVPAGLDQTGVPVGAQLLGRASDEATLITLAAELERHRGWTAVRPGVAGQG